MMFSRPRLHAPVIQTAEQEAAVQSQIKAIVERRMAAAPTMRPAAPGSPVTIPLTSVTQGTSFDSFIHVRFRGG